MTPSQIGLGIGGVAGIASYLGFKVASGRVARPQSRKVLKIVGLADLFLMPLLGWLIGKFIFEGAM